MAIPGMRSDDLPVRAKVRTGIKKKSASGKEYPASVDYFVCDDEKFRLAVKSAQPKELRIRFHSNVASEVFETGLEWWLKNGLACFTKGEPADEPLAFRLQHCVTTLNVVRGDPTASGRSRIVCDPDTCAEMQEGKCKPIGRLRFWLDGGSEHDIFQLDTKSWYGVKNLEGFLKARDGDLKDKVFVLKMEKKKKGTSTFNVLYMEEDMNFAPNTPTEIDKADALLALRKEVDNRKADPGNGDLVTLQLLREKLAAALDETAPGWRDSQAIIDRIKEVGVMQAAEGLLKRYDA